MDDELFDEPEINRTEPMRRGLGGLLNDELIQNVVDGILAGMPLPKILEGLGVQYQNFYRWISYGKHDQDLLSQGKINIRDEGLYYTLYRDVIKARYKRELFLMERLNAALKGELETVTITEILRAGAIVGTKIQKKKQQPSVKEILMAMEVLNEMGKKAGISNEDILSMEVKDEKGNEVEHEVIEMLKKKANGVMMLESGKTDDDTSS